MDAVTQDLMAQGFNEGEVFWVKIIACAIILLVALVIYLLVRWPVRKLLSADDKRRVGGTIFINILRVLVWGTAICFVIDVLFGIDLAGILGALGVVGIAVSLGAQQTIANVIGGIIVSLSPSIGPGDWIAIKGHKEARFVDTNWRTTTLEDEDGIQYEVPNAVMVSDLVEKRNPFFTIVVPFSLKVTTPDVEKLLVECEQVLLDRQIEKSLDYEAMRPRAHVCGASLGAIQAEVKIFVDRKLDTRSVERAVLPPLIELLQEREALADIPQPAA